MTLLPAGKRQPNSSGCKYQTSGTARRQAGTGQGCRTFQVTSSRECWKSILRFGVILDLPTGGTYWLYPRPAAIKGLPWVREERWSSAKEGRSPHCRHIYIYTPFFKNCPTLCTDNISVCNTHWGTGRRRKHLPPPELSPAPCPITPAEVMEGATIT